MDRVAVTLCKAGDKEGPEGWPKSVVQYNPKVVQGDKVPKADKDMDLDEYQEYCVGMRPLHQQWEAQNKAEESVKKHKPQQVLPLVDPNEEDRKEREEKIAQKKEKKKH